MTKPIKPKMEVASIITKEDLGDNPLLLMQHALDSQSIGGEVIYVTMKPVTELGPYIARFYGSCGHITNEVVSAEEFDKLSAARVVKTICGDETVKAEVTIDDEKSVVHIHPDRFCICKDCMEKEIESL